MTVKNKIVTLLLIAILATITFATAMTLYQLLIRTSGTIPIAEELTATPSSIDWEIVALDTPISKLVDVDNAGTVDYTTLTITTENASANLLDFTLTHNYTDEALPAGYYLTISFTLTVYAASSGPFSFDIKIVGNP